MAQAVAKYAAKKMLAKEMENFKDRSVDSKYDPYYEMIPHPRKRGKFKKVKKQIPAYIPPHDAEILAQARRRAYKLDLCLFNFAGIRFGWSSVIGIIPAAGDFLDMGMSWLHIQKMKKVECKIPTKLVWYMYFWMAVDFFLGLIPFVGDLADAAMKCNSRNVRLLEERLDEVYKPSDQKKRDRESVQLGERPPPPATVYEDFSDSDREYSPERNGNGGNITSPQPARVPSGRPGEPAPQMSSQGRGLFGGGRRERQPDPEMGYGRDERRDNGRKSGRSGRHRDRR